MNKESKKTLTTAAVGAAIGASVGYAIGSSKVTPCDGCTCELADENKRLSCMEKIKKQKEEYIAHRDSNKCFTDPCDTCPHRN